MKEKQLKQGNEYYYLAGAADFNDLQKVYYAFTRVLNNNGIKRFQYIFAKNKDTLTEYSNIDIYEKKLSESDFIGFSHFVIDDDLRFFRPYTKSTENRVQKMYKFFTKYDKTYRKLLKYTKFYSSGNESFFWSNFFTTFRKNMFLYRIRFFFRLFIYILLGTLKLPFYILIFVFDIFKSSINSYKIFKDKEASVKFYESNPFMNSKMLNISEAEFYSRKESEQKELEEIKEKYINSNIAIFTLLIAFGTLIFSLVENTKSVRQIQKLNSENNAIISSLKEENLILRNQLNTEESKSQLLENIIDTYKLNESHVENLEKSLNESKYNEQN